MYRRVVRSPSSFAILKSATTTARSGLHQMPLQHQQGTLTLQMLLMQQMLKNTSSYRFYRDWKQMIEDKDFTRMKQELKSESIQELFDYRTEDNTDQTLLHLMAKSHKSLPDSVHDQMRQNLSLLSEDQVQEAKQWFNHVDISGQTAMHVAIQEQNNSTDVSIVEQRRTKLKERLIRAFSKLAEQKRVRKKVFVADLLRVDNHFQRFVSMHPQFLRSLDQKDSNGTTVIEFCIKNHMADELIYFLLSYATKLRPDNEEFASEFRSILSMIEELDEQDCEDTQKDLLKFFARTVSDRKILSDSYTAHQDDLFILMVGMMLVSSDPAVSFEYLMQNHSGSTIFHQSLKKQPPQKLYTLPGYIGRHFRKLKNFALRVFSKRNKEQNIDVRQMEKVFSDLLKITNPIIFLWVFQWANSFNKQADSEELLEGADFRPELYSNVQKMLTMTDSSGNTLLHYCNQSLTSSLALLCPVALKMDGQTLKQLQKIKNKEGKTPYHGASVMYRFWLRQLTKFALATPSQRKSTLSLWALALLLVIVPWSLLLLIITFKVCLLIIKVVCYVVALPFRLIFG